MQPKCERALVGHSPPIPAPAHACAKSTHQHTSRELCAGAGGRRRVHPRRDRHRRHTVPHSMPCHTAMRVRVAPRVVSRVRLCLSHSRRRQRRATTCTRTPGPGHQDPYLAFGQIAKINITAHLSRLRAWRDAMRQPRRDQSGGRRARTGRPPPHTHARPFCTACAVR